MAAVPHRARAAHVPHRRLGALPRTSTRRFADAVVAEAQDDGPGRAGAGLPLRAAAADDPRAPARRDHHHVLAHPWPNPEAFAICPWRDELLDGLLGSSILGFHTQFHCNNFLDTVDRLLEARVDREIVHDLVPRRSRPRCTAIRSRSSGRPRRSRTAKRVADARRAVRERLGLPRDHRLGVGIDRLDYTKGILERFNAVARLLELEPRWIGRFTFVQIAAPSRGDDRRLSRLRGARARAAPTRSTRAIADAQLPADRAARRAPRAGRRLRVLSRRRPVLREQPARRHEPGRQGVRRRARRRAGRADPVAVRRRVARAARGADRQSLRRRPVRGGAAPRADDARRRAARPDAPHARRRARVQRLPLGRAHAARRGGDAPARPLPRRPTTSRGRG